MKKDNGNQITSSLSFAIAASTFIVSFGPLVSDYYLPITLCMLGLIMASVYVLATHTRCKGETSHEDLMTEYDIIDKPKTSPKNPHRKWSPLSRWKPKEVPRSLSTGATPKRGSLTLDATIEEDKISNGRPRSKTTAFFRRISNAPTTWLIHKSFWARLQPKERSGIDQIQRLDSCCFSSYYELKKQQPSRIVYICFKGIQLNNNQVSLCHRPSSSVLVWRCEDIPTYLSPIPWYLLQQPIGDAMPWYLLQLFNIQVTQSSFQKVIHSCFGSLFRENASLDTILDRCGISC